MKSKCRMRMWRPKHAPLSLWRGLQGELPDAQISVWCGQLQVPGHVSVLLAQFQQLVAQLSARLLLAASTCCRAFSPPLTQKLGLCSVLKSGATRSCHSQYGVHTAALPDRDPFSCHQTVPAVTSAPKKIRQSLASRFLVTTSLLARTQTSSRPLHLVHLVHPLHGITTIRYCYCGGT